MPSDGGSKGDASGAGYGGPNGLGGSDNGYGGYGSSGRSGVPGTLGTMGPAAALAAAQARSRGEMDQKGMDALGLARGYDGRGLGIGEGNISWDGFTNTMNNTTGPAMGKAVAGMLGSVPGAMIGGPLGAIAGNMLAKAAFSNLDPTGTYASDLATDPDTAVAWGGGADHPFGGSPNPFSGPSTGNGVGEDGPGMLAVSPSGYAGRYQDWMHPYLQEQYKNRHRRA